MRTRSLGLTLCLVIPLALATGGAGCTRTGSGISDCEEGRTRCSGTCVDTERDPDNCGGCGIVCTAGGNAVAGCIAGQCTTECAPGFTDCDGDPANGCEANLQQDDLNCGLCGNTCEGRACEQGLCTGDCAAGYQECGTQCVDTANDPQNCGSCGLVCSLSNATAACASGQCVIDSCSANFDDCDGDPATGCETDLLQDDINCGQCGNVCATGIACGSGECLSPGVLCGGVTCPVPQLCCQSGGGMGGTTSCYDPATQVCSGSVLECDGSSDCVAGEVCCREEAVDPYAATCTSTCSDTVLCSQSLDCPVDAPFCCPSGAMVTTNICEPNPC